MTGRPGGVRRSLLGLLLVPLLVTLLGGVVLLGAAPASAHAVLIGVRPGDGSTTATAPSRVTAIFDDNIRTPSVVIVTGADGTRVDHGSTAIRDNTASVPVTLVESGRYTMSYRVVSADGHPVSGQSRFTFTGGTSPSASPSASPSTSPSATGSGSVGSLADSSGAGSSTLLLAGGAVLVLVAGGGLLLTARRRQPRLRENGRAAPDDPAESAHEQQ